MKDRQFEPGVFSKPLPEEFKFLILKKTSEGYEYAERKGVHSIAFILLDEHTNQVCLRLEYKPPVGEWILGAFGGSIDKGRSLIDLVKQEVLEEAGFEVEDDAILFAGRYFVSTQMNQYCYLFAVTVDKEKQGKPTNPDNHEKMSDYCWVNIKSCTSCWKAAIIQTRLKEMLNL